MIRLFSQKHAKEDMFAFFLLEKNEIMLLTYETNGRGMILFHSRDKFSYHRLTITNLNAANSEMFQVNTFVNFLLSFIVNRENRQAGQEIHSFSSLKLSKHF